MLVGIDVAGLDLAAIDSSDFADLGEFDCLAEPPVRNRKQRQSEARAVRTRSRISMRRAKSQAMLRNLLPPFIEDGDSWHVISSGDVDSLSFLQHLMACEPWQYLMVSTWCMAMQDVEQLAAWLAAGQLQWLDVYTGEILPSQYPTVHETLCAAVRNHRGRVATFRNHSKVMLLGNHETGRFVVVESSANLNTNPRTEQTAVTANAGLFHFYADYFDGIQSFNNNFSSWAPWRQAAQLVQ